MQYTPNALFLRQLHVLMLIHHDVSPKQCVEYLIIKTFSDLFCNENCIIRKVEFEYGG